MKKVWEGWIKSGTLGYAVGIIPGACYLMPAQRRTISVISGPAAMASLLPKLYFLSLPNLIFTCCGTRPHVLSLLVNAIPTTKFTTDTTLYPLPLPNSFAFGSVCLGCDINDFTHEQLVACYFNSPFESVHLSGCFQPRSLSNISEYVSTFEQWAEATKIDPDYGKHIFIEEWDRSVWDFSEIAVPIPGPKFPPHSKVRTRYNAGGLTSSPEWLMKGGLVINIYKLKGVYWYTVRNEQTRSEMSFPEEDLEAL